MFAVESRAYNCVRNGRGDAGVAAAGELCGGGFFAGYAGRAEAGHIALVSGGEIYSLVTNQEYKRAFEGNLGIVAGAPLGGLVEKDPEDKYGLAQQLLHPLAPWFRKVKYHGPIQVTAVKSGGKWVVIEYNVRIGITAGPMILRLLKNPLETVFLGTARDERLVPRFRGDVKYGCSLTLAGYGYPYVQVRGPQVPVEVEGSLDCDVWWNEAAAGTDGEAEGRDGSPDRGCERAGGDVERCDCQGVSKYLKDTRAGELLSRGRGKESLATGEGVISPALSTHCVGGEGEWFGSAGEYGSGGYIFLTRGECPSLRLSSPPFLAGRE